MSSLTLPASGSMRNGVCTPRPTLVPLIDGNGSGLWPSPLARDSKGEGFDNTNLPNSGRMWGTPVARDDQKSPEAHMAMKARMDRNTATPLTVQAKRWPTPCAREAKGNPGPNAQMATTGSVATAFPHAPTTTTGGSNGMVLNPQFVAALMGLPTGWLTPSTSAATVWCRSVQQKRGDNSPNDWNTE